MKLKKLAGAVAALQKVVPMVKAVVDEIHPLVNKQVKNGEEVVSTAHKAADELMDALEALKKSVSKIKE